MKLLMNAIAWFISILFHPLIYATLGVFVIVTFLPQYYALNVSYSIKILKFIFLLTYIIPLVSVPIYYLILKLTKSVAASNHQRFFLLLTTAIIYTFSYRILVHVSIFETITVYILLCAVLMIISLIITYFWKISLHMIGIGGFIGLLLALSLVQINIAYYILPLSFVIAGLIGSSRLYLQAHSTKQIYIGFLLGLVVSFIFSSLLITQSA